MAHSPIETLTRLKSLTLSSKRLSVQLAQPLFIIFRMSLETGMLPDDWKIAQISPIFKKGHRCKPGNYRHVSLTAIISKILEKLVR